MSRTPSIFFESADVILLFSYCLGEDMLFLYITQHIFVEGNPFIVQIIDINIIIIVARTTIFAIRIIKMITITFI